MKTIVLQALHSYPACAVMAALILPACFSASGQEIAKLKSSIEEMNSKFPDVFRRGNAVLKCFPVGVPA